MTLPITLTYFSANITLLRTVHGYTQAQIAKEFNIGRTAVSNWEKGISYPQFSDAVKLANLHGVSLDQLVMPTEELEMWLLHGQRDGPSMHRIPKKQREMVERVEKRLAKNKTQADGAVEQTMAATQKQLAAILERLARLEAQHGNKGKKSG